jgi:hypothetical protein
MAADSDESKLITSPTPHGETINARTCESSRYSIIEIKLLILMKMAVPDPQNGQIPVIDISGSSPDVDIAESLVKAASTYGFVYIKNKGKDIPVKVIDDMFDVVW